LGSCSSARYIIGVVRGCPDLAPMLVSSSTGASPNPATHPPLDRNAAMCVSGFDRRCVRHHLLLSWCGLDAQCDTAACRSRMSGITRSVFSSYRP
jgi:hypothetical protein